MRITFVNDVLSIGEIEKLAARHSELFRNQVRASWPASPLKAIEIDLSQTSDLDSSGLGALLAVHNWAAGHDGNGAIPVRLINPKPPVQHLLEITRLHRTFEIVKRSQTI